MEKIVTLNEDMSIERLSQIIKNALLNYPKILKAEEAIANEEDRKLAELYMALHKAIEFTLKNSDGLKPEDFVKTINATQTQLDAISKIWTNSRDNLLVGKLLSKKGGLLEDEDKYTGMGWELRMISAGKGIQSINQPIALLQITTTNASFFSIMQ